MVDYVTDIPAEEALDRAQVYFATRWPHGGQYTREGNAVVWSAVERQGCIKAVLSFFVAIGTLFIYVPLPKKLSAQLLAFREDGRTRLIITANRPAFSDTLARFAVDELDAEPA